MLGETPRSRNAAHRAARDEARRQGAAKVPRTLAEADAPAVQAAAEASGRAYVAVLVSRAPGRRWACAVRVFRPGAEVVDRRAEHGAA